MRSRGKALLYILSRWTSCKANKYLSGFLSEARLVSVRCEPNGDGTPTWNLYVQVGKE